MSYQQGDIILVPFPYTDLTGNKVRPAIIVSNSKVHRSGDVIIVQMTSQSITGDLAIQIGNRDVTTPFKPPHDTQYIYCKKIATVSQGIIHKTITRIKDSSKIIEILNCVKSAFQKD